MRPNVVRTVCAGVRRSEGEQRRTLLLVGLVLNAALGWSWADPIAALVIAAIAVKEGRDAWQGKGCRAPPAPTPAPVAAAEADTCGCKPSCTCCS